MNRDTLKQIMVDQKDIYLNNPIISRHYPLEDNVNYCFVGIRRTGKSYMMYQQIKRLKATGVPLSQIVYVNFEDERLLEMTADDLNTILEIGLEISGTDNKPYLFLDEILLFLQIPAELAADMRTYLLIIFAGLLATSVYNFFACLLRAVGNSVAPLWFLGISALLNIGLDLLFVLVFHWGIAGAAAATVFSQYVSGVGLLAYTFLRCREFLPSRAELRFRREILRELLDLSMLTCAQQSAMNFGILLIQRLVDSFGPITMAAFAAAVKIDTFAYLPVQDFGNAFSTFVAQNFGAGRTERLRRGFRQALLLSAGFSVVLSALVCIFAHPLMHIFVQAGETEVLAAGVRYLRVEGAFYAEIGCLFLLYGFYRAVKRPGMSVVLTVISLGTRVALAYALAGTLGEVGIWVAIPIGWALADLTGLGYYLLRRTKLLGGMEKAEI